KESPIDNKSLNNSNKAAKPDRGFHEFPNALVDYLVASSERKKEEENLTNFLDSVL
ncbi:unnamed protein product, partial [Amoebophrya sp. A120]